jgi:CHRD domain
MRPRVLLLALFATLAVPAVAAAVASVGAGMSPVVSAKLLGRNEVPKVASAGSGLVVIHLDGTKQTVCWTFARIAKINKPTAAHIHKAVAGKAGPVVVPLGAAYKSKGCTKAAATVIGAIEEHPAAYYVNIHTGKYPDGAARGNLVPGMHG